LRYMKIKKFVKNGRYLDIYVKKPFFNSNKLYYKLFDKYNDNINYNFDVIYDVIDKYIICRFWLRDVSDVEPYIRKGSEE